ERTHGSGEGVGVLRARARPCGIQPIRLVVAGARWRPAVQPRPRAGPSTGRAQCPLSVRRRVRLSRLLASSQFGRTSAGTTFEEGKSTCRFLPGSGGGGLRVGRARRVRRCGGGGRAGRPGGPAGGRGGARGGVRGGRCQRGWRRDGGGGVGAGAVRGGGGGLAVVGGAPVRRAGGRTGLRGGGGGLQLLCRLGGGGSSHRPRSPHPSFWGARASRTPR